jgi:hypothetical protein
MRLIQYIKDLHHDFKNSLVKRLRTREVVRVLSVAHAAELKETPIELWQTKIAEHKQQIQAVMAGKLDIVNRRSWAYPYLPESLHRLNQPILKSTPYNLRRFSETPIPRRAINLIKNSVIMTLPWEIRPVAEVDDVTPDIEKRIRIATHVFKHPNQSDSFRTFSEKVVEDIIVGAYGCFEPRITPDPKRPILMWAVDGSTIRIYPDWTEAVKDEKPHYAQMTGLKGERGIIAFYDHELVYIRDNSRSSTPFGLGKMEIAFNVINYFLGSQEAAGRAGADQIHKTMLWWQQAQQKTNLETVRRYVMNELEGQSKISMIANMPKPEIIDINPVTPEDLLLDWQEFQIKIIGAAFDISPLALNMTQDVNKAVGKVMSDADFQSAVVPMAIRLSEAYTYEVLHKRLGWTDIEFAFKGLDDPDQLTKSQIQQRDYQMNAIVPDEIRQDKGRPPLPGGWGKLTSGQMQILIAQAKPSTGTGGAGGYGSQGQLPSGTSPGGSGVGSIGAGGFTTDDIMDMTPEDIEYLQEEGLLPATNQIGNQMEQEQPGILETLTQQLKEFFDVTNQMDEEGEAQEQPSPINQKDIKDQQKKFAKDKHRPSWQEIVVNRKYQNDSKNLNPATKRFPRELKPDDRKVLRGR